MAFLIPAWIILSKFSMVIATQFYRRLGKQARRLVRQTGRRHLEILRRDFHADAVAAPFRCGNVSRAGAHERIEHCVSDKAEHADKPLRKLQRIRRWVISSGSAGYPSPYLLKPLLVVLRGDHAEHASGKRRRAIAARLALHQDEFDVVLDDRVRLVRLPEKTASVARRFINRVGDLVPDDGREIGEAQVTAVLLDRRVQRNDRMDARVLAARQAYVTDDTDQSPARHKRLETTAPHRIQLFEKSLVVGHITELPVRALVFLQRPVRRGGNNQMHTLRFYKSH